MATVYGTNYTAAYVTTPSQGVAASDSNGRMCLAYDSYTTNASETAGSTITMCTNIPAGARVVELIIDHGALGTSVTLAAAIDGVEFVAAVNCASAGLKYRLTGKGVDTKVAAAAPVVITTAGATLTTAIAIRVIVYYQLS
jgi:hypothetical protein